MKLVYFVILLIIISLFAKPNARAEKQKIINLLKKPNNYPHLGRHRHIHLVHTHLPNYHKTIVNSGVHSHLTQINTPLSEYHKSALNYINIARLAYCPKNLILAKRCEVCPFVLNQYKTFFIHSVKQNMKNLFQFIIIFSDIRKEIIITFSGPKTKETKFFNKIYKKGFITVKELGENVKIENYYWEIYSKYMRSILRSKIEKILKSKRSEYKVIFIGHSFGGSIAVLAAYDLVKNRIVKKNNFNSSHVIFSYGQMRIGDNSFISEVNKLIKLIRIMRSDDFVTRVPSCVFDESEMVFKCYSRVATVVKNYPIFKNYFIDYRRGIRIYRKTIQKLYRFSKTAVVHYHTYFTQPLGTLLLYKGNDFSTYHECPIRNGILTCEEKIILPNTFTASVHQHYFGIDVESC